MPLPSTPARIPRFADEVRRSTVPRRLSTSLRLATMFLGWRGAVASSTAAASTWIVSAIVAEPELIYFLDRGGEDKSLLTPLVFLAMFGGPAAYKFLSRRRRFLTLLQKGTLASATLRRSEWLEDDGGDHQLSFEFRDGTDGGLQVYRIKTSQPDKLSDEAEEPLLYLPEDPRVACLLDEIPGYPRLHAGVFTHGNKRWVVAMAVAFHAVCLLLAASAPVVFLLR